MLLLYCETSVLAANRPITLTQLRSSTSAENTRIVFQFDKVPVYDVIVQNNGRQIIVNFSGVNAAVVNKNITIDKDIISNFKIDNTQAGCRATINLVQKLPYEAKVLQNPARIFIDIKKYYQYLQTNKVKNGLEYTMYYQSNEAGKLRAYILDIDPAKYSFIPVLGGGRQLGKNTVLNMNNYYGAVATVNASYFGGSKEIYGLTKIDGTIVSTTYLPRTAFGVDDAGKPMIDTVNYEGSIHTKYGNFPINGVNCARDANTIVEYNSFYGSSTQTNEYGIEYVVENNKIVAINTNDTELKDNQTVISAHGTMKEALQNLKVGDEMVINDNVGSDKWNKAPQIVGVGPRLIKDGKSDITSNEEQIGPDVYGGRSPRTALGIKKDGHVLLVVADGRQDDSDGLTLKQLSGLLLEMGAQDAINFDGGGSSEMVLDDKIVNSPSDGMQRPVGVGLAVLKK